MALFEQVTQILKSTGFEDSQNEIEKGYTKNIVVPPQNGKKGYSYVRNYDGIEGKKQNKRRESREVETIDIEFKKKMLNPRDIKNLAIVTDSEFSNYVDYMYNKAYKKIPSVIRLPDLNGKLTQKLHLDNVHCYMLQERFKHTNFSRKKSYNQDLRIDEYKAIPHIIRNAKYALYSNKLKNFSLFELDKNDKTKVNTVSFNKDRYGNYIVTVSKKDVSSYGPGEWKVIGVGVAPTIHEIFKSRPATALPASPINNYSLTNINTPVNKSIRFDFVNITPLNRKDKLEKAVKVLSKQLGIPVNIERNNPEHTGEPFHFDSQKELTYAWYDYFSNSIKEVYRFVIETFGLPESNVIQKAGELKHKGQILYSPETGEPIKKSDWDKFVKTLENLLNKKFAGAGKKIVLDSRTLGRLLDRMLKYNKLPEVKSIKIPEIKYSGKTFEKIAESENTFEKVLGPDDSKRIELLQESAAERITGMSDKLKNDVKQTLIDGVKLKKSKQQISQDLFNKLSGTNRDFHKIADTEIQNNINNAFLAEETENLKEDEKAYFQRVEVIDGNTCPFCKKMNGIIAVWSNVPLSSDKVDADPYATHALWEGKDWNGTRDSVCNGVFHPYCRGIWVRWNAGVNAYMAALQKKNEKYNKAVDIAREEFKSKGYENPNDKTPGYIERINELYKV